MIPTRIGQQIDNATFIGFVQTASQIRWVAVDTKLRLNDRIPLLATLSATDKTCGAENTQKLIAAYSQTPNLPNQVPLQTEMVANGVYIPAQYEAVLIKKQYSNISQCVPRTRTNETSLTLEEFISKYDDTTFMTSTVSKSSEFLLRAWCVDIKLSRPFTDLVTYMMGHVYYVKSNVACENACD